MIRHQTLTKSHLHRSTATEPERHESSSSSNTQKELQILKEKLETLMEIRDRIKFMTKEVRYLLKV